VASPYDDGWLLDQEPCVRACSYGKHDLVLQLNGHFLECAKVALANDFDPVPWEDAPQWRRDAAVEVANAALNTGNPDKAREAWLLAMTTMGWRWDPVLDEQKKTHPGIVFGELTRGGTKHWMNVVDRVRQTARELGVRMTGP